MFAWGTEKVPFCLFPSVVHLAERNDRTSQPNTANPAARRWTGNRLVDLERPFNWLHSSQGCLLPLSTPRCCARGIRWEEEEEGRTGWIGSWVRHFVKVVAIHRHGVLPRRPVKIDPLEYFRWVGVFLSSKLDRCVVQRGFKVGQCYCMIIGFFPFFSWLWETGGEEEKRKVIVSFDSIQLASRVYYNKNFIIIAFSFVFHKWWIQSWIRGFSFFFIICVKECCLRK